MQIKWLSIPDVLRSSVTLYIVIAVMLGAVLLRTKPRRSSDRHKRGALLLDGRERSAARLGSPDELTLAGVRIPLSDETKHFKLIGTTGSGKSTAILELLSQALARGDRAVFADPDGGYQARLFDRFRGDVVLNPFEPESVRWDPFAEIYEAYDVEQLAAALIPTVSDPSANEWRGYARTFLAAVMRGCRFERQRSCGELWRLLSTASVEELRMLVAATPAQPFLEADNARMFGSIRSVAVSAMAALEHITAQRAVAFSVRQWVSAIDNSRALFIPYKASQIAALRALIATWMRLAIFEAMNGVETRSGGPRLWFVVDELDALGVIDGLKDALARLRKFGGRCVLGFQSIAQVSGTYGAAESQTIVENCGNTLILRCSASENGGTSQFASKLIGDREVIRRQISRGSDRGSGLSGSGARRSKNVSDQHVTEAAVMPSQIEQLPDLTGYFKSASSIAWLKVSLNRQRKGEP